MKIELTTIINYWTFFVFKDPWGQILKFIEFEFLKDWTGNHTGSRHWTTERLQASGFSDSQLLSFPKFWWLISVFATVRTLFQEDGAAHACCCMICSYIVVVHYYSYSLLHSCIVIPIVVVRPWENFAGSDKYARVVRLCASCMVFSKSGVVFLVIGVSRLGP